jgi:hypothetical protein
MDFLQPHFLIQLFAASILAILFLQSGLDKVFDSKGNLEWLNEHFSNTIFKSQVKVLFFTLTAVELLAGVVSFSGVISLIFLGVKELAFYGAVLSALSLVMLFFGQRIAKEYTGAGSLVGYMIFTVIALYFLGC